MRAGKATYYVIPGMAGLLALSCVEEIEIRESKSNKKTVIISVRPQDRGKAIGKEGSMIRKIKTLVLRHFEVDNVIINTKN